MSRWSLRRARARLTELAQEMAEIEQEGYRMVEEFKCRFPDAPVYLSRYTDRTFTRWRWRKSSSRRWRGKRPRGINPSIELLGDEGRAMLRQLPESVQQVWLRYERRRVDLNLSYALARYERERIEDWLARRAVLAQAAAGGAGAENSAAGRAE